MRTNVFRRGSAVDGDTDSFYYDYRSRLTNTENISQVIFDSDEKPLSFALTGDQKYRTWTDYSKISPQLIRATVRYEDRFYYWHPGVNPFSVARAIISYPFSKRALGASTLTMQLVRKRFNLNTKSYIGKLKQMYFALLLEAHYTKQQILEAYLNIAPYGGNIEGVGAAARIYFHKEPSRLREQEAQLLTLLPQNPSNRGPLSSGGKLKLAEAWSKVFQLDPKLMAVSLFDKGTLVQSAPHFSDRVHELYGAQHEFHSTLDSNLQNIVEKVVADFLSRNVSLDIHNATAMIVYAPHMDVRAYVGSGGYTNSTIKGFVNGLKAKRSPGSTLKPFVYALGIDQGLITPDTLLKDRPIRISEYRPENFERNFLGPLSATESLVRSRNIPAVELAQRLKPALLYDFLKKGGVRLDKSESYYGLSLVLGAIDLSMEELVRLYGIFTNSGQLKPLRWDARESSEDKVVQLISPEAAYLTRTMLEENPRPSELFGTKHFNSKARIAWKTGTSFGSKDAWAIGMVGDYIVGVWVGNFDGSPNPNFVGRDTAGPLLFSVTDALQTEYSVGASPTKSGLKLKQISVCALSGMPANENCPHKKLGWVIPGVSPIAECDVHRMVRIDSTNTNRLCAGAAGGKSVVIEVWDSTMRQLFAAAGIKRAEPPAFTTACENAGGGEGKSQAPRIISPQARTIYQIGNSAPNLEADEEIRTDAIELNAIADGSRRVFWFIDKELVGEGARIFWKGRAGKFTAQAVDDQGSSASVTFTVEVAATVPATS